MGLRGKQFMDLTTHERHTLIRLYKHKGKFLNRKFPQPMSPKENAGIVCDFYNLQLTFDSPDMENLHGIDKRIWDKEEDINRIKDFLVKHEPHFSDHVNHETDMESQLELQLSVTCQECCNETDEKGFLKKFSWFETHFFKLFLVDYIEAYRAIDNLIEGRVHFESLEWLEDLHKELLVSHMFFPESRSNHFDGLRNFYFDEPENPYYDWSQVKFHTMPFYSYKFWGIRIENIGRAIFEGFAAILTEAIKIRRCEFPHCGKPFIVSSQGRYGHSFCDENCRKREERRPYYQCLAAYVAEWLLTQKESERTYKAKTLAESLGQYVREKHNPDFSLKPREVGVKFREQHLNPYLQEHGFWCKREGERRPYDYTFEKLLCNKSSK